MFRAIICISLSVLLGALFPIEDVHAEQADAPQTLAALQAAIKKAHKEHEIPGMAVAIVNAEEPLWVEAFGQADREKAIPATRDTLFRIGSVSKMFAALAVLKLVEQGDVSLDAPVRELAPEIEFENPWRARHPVRLVHLLEHTAGWDDMRFPEMAHSEPTPIDLKDALALYPQSRVSRWIPGTRFAYSNIGPAVTAYIVEKITGRQFESYIAETFFKPLGMKNATYFKPDGRDPRVATGYIDGRPQEYWHVMYRPAGSINASIDEMTRFLQFMIGRGNLGDKHILSAQSITRMETPETALGAAQGVTAGCGLHNCTSGFGNKGVAFHGHDGGGFGFSARLAYSPEQQSGYVLLLTGNTPGQSVISELIRGYLLRDVQPPDLQDSALPDAFRDTAGLYRPIAPRAEALEGLTGLLGTMRFSTGDNVFHRSPLFGGWQSRDIATGGEALVDTWTGLPTVAVVEDPLAGQAVAVNAGNLYQPVSGVRVYGVAILALSMAILNAVVVVGSLFWITGWIRGRLGRGAGLQMRLWPALCGYASCVYIALLGMLLPRTDASLETIRRLGTLTWASGSLFAAGVAYLAIAAAGTIMVFRHRHCGVSRALFWFSLAVVSVNLLATFYLTACGLIGFRSWSY